MLVYHLHYNQMALDRRKEKKKSQKNIYCLHVCSPLSSVFRLLCREELNSWNVLMSTRSFWFCLWNHLYH